MNKFGFICNVVSLLVRRGLFLLALFLTLGHGNLLHAGGPENLILVVNAKSKDSLEIANHYAALRNIPDRNVIMLGSVPEDETIKIEDFQQKILKPLLKEMDQRKFPARQIELIVYSSDFPTRVRLPKDANQSVRPKEIQKYFATTASLNALTFFAQQVMKDDYTFVGPTANFYFRKTGEEVLAINPFVGQKKTDFAELQSAYKAGAYEDAFKFAELLIDDRSPSPVVRFRAAQCLARLKRDDEAINMLQAAVKDGWHFAKLTRTSQDFEKLKEETKFQQVIEEMQQLQRVPVSSFSGTHFWRPNGFPSTSPETGRRYFLSVMLGVSRGKGNSVDEILAALKSSVEADNSNPQGTFYFVSNNQVRARTRAPLIPEAIEALKTIGMSAESISSRLPAKKSDVIGFMMGAAKFDWSGSGSTIVPGAICDNLTSFGGLMTGKPGTGQTTVAEFIKHGAAGASGTVVEPFTIPHKFPHPMIHYYYARGCNLAESFYQAVHGPYQLLIVGDPLCRPFGKQLDFQVLGIADPKNVKGKLKLSIQSGSTTPISTIDFYYDDALVRSASASEPISFDSTKAPDGFHVFRVVAKTSGAVQFSATRTVRVFVRNRGLLPAIKAATTEPKLDGSLVIRLSSPIDAKLVARKFGEKLETKLVKAKGSSKLEGISLACDQLGAGPSTIRVFAEKNSASLCLGTVTINVNK